jgi:hypothetical protein
MFAKGGLWERKWVRGGDRGSCEYYRKTLYTCMKIAQ